MITPKVRFVTLGTSHPSNVRVPRDAGNVLPPPESTQPDASRQPVQFGDAAFAPAPSRPGDPLDSG